MAMRYLIRQLRCISGLQFRIKLDKMVVSHTLESFPAA